MSLPSIFQGNTTQSLIERINNLTPNTQPQWGKMNVSQMLAHCNVAYEMTYEDKHSKPGFVMRLMLKSFVKSGVVNETPYPKNSRTAPQFIISDNRDFEVEKKRLIDYLTKTQQLGAAHFDGRENLSFGPMNVVEWSNLFYKHLDHHLSQFGV